MTTQQLSRIEAKVDLIQYELCKGGSIAGLPFLDPKRKKAEEQLAAKYSGEAQKELYAFLEVIAAGELDALDAQNKKNKVARKK
jgi:hypothetical protein